MDLYVNDMDYDFKKIHLILDMNSMYFKMVILKNDYDNENFPQLLASKFGSFIFRKTNN